VPAFGFSGPLAKNNYGCQPRSIGVNDNDGKLKSRAKEKKKQSASVTKRFVKKGPILSK
jgi:hypothetical protein